MQSWLAWLVTTFTITANALENINSYEGYLYTSILLPELFVQVNPFHPAQPEDERNYRHHGNCCLHDRHHDPVAMPSKKYVLKRRYNQHQKGRDCKHHSPHPSHEKCKTV